MDLHLLPEGLSTVSGEVDRLWNVILVVTLIAFFATQGVLVWALVKFRAKDDGRKAAHVHGNHRLEVVWTIVPGILLVVMGVMQAPSWDRIKVDFPERPDVEVQVLARSYTWNFRHAGNDGKFGTRDDVVMKSLTVPVDSDVVLTMRSEDVLHSFYVPEFRLKQDVVPGREVRLWFNATEVREWTRDDKGVALTKGLEVACAELCGLGHTTMRADLNILSKDRFSAWLKAESDKGTFLPRDKSNLWYWWRYMDEWRDLAAPPEEWEEGQPRRFQPPE